MNIAITLSQENIKLSTQEALTLTKPTKHKQTKNLLLLKTTTPKKTINQLKKASYTKDIILLNQLPKKGTYAYKKINITHKAQIPKQKILPPKTKVNLNNPQTTIAIIGLKKTLYGTLIKKNKDNYEQRKPHNRPKNHPTSIHPKIAKAMINLADTQKITDPFCGSGGILIEGSLLKKTMTGIDNNQKMLEYAKENLKHYQQKANLIQKDTTTTTIKQTIVTDIPYGKNSPTTTTNKKILTWLFNQPTQKIILCSNKKLRSRKNFKLKARFDFKIHKSMNRHIHVFYNSSILE